jgi:predicted DsbA family dithiol-disulfide isomerase
MIEPRAGIESSSGRRRQLVATALAGAIGVGVGAVAMHLLVPAGRGTAAMEATVHDYILGHPEILPEAMHRLEMREAAKGISAERRAIETPFASAWAGNPRGDVTLVMFTDYSCGYCRASAPDVKRLLAEDSRLKVVWREIPILGPDSETAARAALAAARQGKYLAFHQAIFAGGRADPARVVAVTREVGLDAGKLAADESGADVQHEIAANLALAGRLGVSGTPAFVIGDQILSGAVGYDALVKAIAEARKS